MIEMRLDNFLYTYSYAAMQVYLNNKLLSTIKINKATYENLFNSYSDNLFL